MGEDDRIRCYQDAVAIVTGGASGIGQALGEALAERGAEVVLADKNLERASGVADAIKAAGGRASAVELDVADGEAVAEVVRRTWERCGRLDYMFNNAGVGVGGEAVHYSVDDWEMIVGVNLLGVTNGVCAAYPLMARQGFGHIVNTASMLGMVPASVAVCYSTTKFAIVGLSRSLRAEAALYGVRVSALCPGVIRTALLTGGEHGRVPDYISRDAFEASFEDLRPMDPKAFAPKALRGVARNKAVIIVPGWWRLFLWLEKIAPGLVDRVNRASVLDARKKLGTHRPLEESGTS